MANGSTASEAMASARSSAGCPAASSAAHRRQVGPGAGGGLDVDHEHRLNPMPRIVPRNRLDRSRVRGARQSAGCSVTAKPDRRAISAPGARELPGAGDEHRVAEVEQVDQGHVPSTVAVGRAGEHLARRAEHRGEVGEARAGQRGEAALGEVVAGALHGSRHPLGHRGRARELGEVAAARRRPGCSRARAGSTEAGRTAAVSARPHGSSVPRRCNGANRQLRSMSSASTEANARCRVRNSARFSNTVQVTAWTTSSGVPADATTTARKPTVGTGAPGCSG